MKRKNEPAEQSTSLRANKVSAQTVLLTIREVGEILGIGQTKAYALRREGLPVIRMGRALRVSSVKLQEWIKQHEQEY